MSSELIQLEGVYYTYDGVAVLEDINLHVNKGEFLGIVGPNGGGKSTLLKLMLGLIKPQSGHIKVLGRRAVSARRKIGYVAQYPTFQRDFPITVEQAVLLGRLGVKGSGLAGFLPGKFNESDRAAVKQALEEVEAGPFSKRLIGNLSGGQLQRMMLARALVSEPEILILDEPTANIDHRVESDIFDLLKQLNERLTILVVSHDIGFISSYVSRVACLNRTLVCHHTDDVEGQVIHELYGDSVRMVAHDH